MEPRPGTRPTRLTGLRDLRDYAAARGLQLLLLLGALLPYETRVRALGWLAARLVAPLTEYPRRIRANLALVRPDLPEAEVRRIVRNVPGNAARTLIEIYSGPEFVARAAAAPVRGAEHLAAAEAAHAAGRPVILVSGHFGNYDVPRALLGARGIPVAGLYRPMSNRYFNPRYVRMIGRISGPVFPRDRRGLAEMLRHLREGGMVGMLIDQRMPHGAPLNFFGRPALTALSAAEMALKYDALLIPAYGLRTGPRGTGFEVIFEPPIPRGDPAAMTQALNDSLERHVRAHMDQWLWLHQRWRDGDRASAG